MIIIILIIMMIRMTMMLMLMIITNIMTMVIFNLISDNLSTWYQDVCRDCIRAYLEKNYQERKYRFLQKRDFQIKQEIL